jgi:hypothetical protein
MAPQSLIPRFEDRTLMPPPPSRPRTPPGSEKADTEMQTAFEDSTLPGDGTLRSKEPVAPSSKMAKMRDVKEVMRMASSSLHKCRGVRKAVVSILKVTPEPQYSALLKGFINNLDKIVTFLEKRRPVSSPVAEAQFIKCQSWVAMVIHPFYHKMEANPAGFMLLLQPEHSAKRKDIIRRISTASNMALKRAMQGASLEGAAYEASPRLEPVSSPNATSGSPSPTFTL